MEIKMTKQEILNHPDFAQLNEIMKKFPKQEADKFYKYLEKQDFSMEGSRRFFVELGSHTPDGQLTDPYRIPE